MATNARYGTAGALALVVGGIVFAITVALQEVGADPAATMRIAGFIGLGLMAVGIAGLLSLLFDVYSDDEITA